MTYIPDALRKQVIERAGDKCEYCLIANDLSAKSHEVDHIYAEKHGGTTILPNLCLSCYYCNRYKGSDLCSIDPLTGVVVDLFHPRHDDWLDHFSLNNAAIDGKTATGRVTIALLQVNIPDRVVERLRFIGLHRYP